MPRFVYFAKDVEDWFGYGKLRTQQEQQHMSTTYNISQTIK